MARTARVVIPGIPHHVTQRGNNRQDIFFTDDDRHNYLRLLAHFARICKLDILGYCLMTNHIHLVAVPSHPRSLAFAMARTHLCYTQYINRLHSRTGHLWQNRFYSCPLDETHALAVIRYIEQNPVRAGIVSNPLRHPWSSAAAHAGHVPFPVLLDRPSWIRDWSPADWRRILSNSLPKSTLSSIRSLTAQGRPLGSDSFIDKLESLVRRPLRAASVGRPIRSQEPARPKHHK